MKIMAASDIHGSLPACERVIERFRQEGADRLLLLGDILYHGPRNNLPEGYNPKAVIALLNAMKEKLLCVRGNCDTEVDQMVLEFPILSDYIYLVSGDKVIFATHGHHYSKENPPFLPEGAILLTGHTHVTADENMGSWRYLNPGSASLPKQETIPSYIIIEDGEIELKAL